MKSMILKFRSVDWKSSSYLIGFFVVLVVINLSTSYLIRNNNIFFVSNKYPFGLAINYFSILAIIVFVTWGLFKFKLVKQFPIYSIFILSGVWSNVIERFATGYVADYINLGISFANLADFEIWAGAILLNIFTWKSVVSKNDESKPNSLGL